MKNFWKSIGCVVVMVVVTGLASPALRAGLPTGFNVVGGDASYTTHCDEMTVTSTTDRTIINWDSFSIWAGHKVDFAQPSSSSAVLNRVVGGDLSSIYGELSSNGRVFLINPNGIVVGASGRINTNGFVGTTLDIADDQTFMDEAPMEFRSPSTGAIANYGTIDGLEGDIYLMARTIDNRGTVKAPKGTVGMYAGHDFIVKEGTSGVPVILGTGSLTGAGTALGISNQNGGRIDAARILLEAAGGNLYATAIANQGKIVATGTVDQDGVVYFKARSDDLIVNTGTVSAKNADGSGGLIAMDAGNDGDVYHGGSLIASSTTGRGGKVQLAGDSVTGASFSYVNVTGQGPAENGEFEISANALSLSNKMFLNGVEPTVSSPYEAIDLPVEAPAVEDNDSPPPAVEEDPEDPGETVPETPEDPTVEEEVVVETETSEETEVPETTEEPDATPENERIIVIDLESNDPRLPAIPERTLREPAQARDTRPAPKAEKPARKAEDKAPAKKEKPAKEDEASDDQEAPEKDAPAASSSADSDNDPRHDDVLLTPGGIIGLGRNGLNPNVTAPLVLERSLSPQVRSALHQAW